MHSMSRNEPKKEHVYVHANSKIMFEKCSTDAQKRKKLNRAQLLTFTQAVNISSLILFAHVKQ